MPYTPELHDAIIRQDLASFIAKCVETVNPGATYLHNWHIDVIADHLNMAYQGHINRLLINIPPRYLKSLCVSVAWPAWILGHTPTSRIIASSYSQPLSTKHSLDCRLVMQSSWYQHLFPETILSSEQNEKNKFMTIQRGFRFATSVGGTVTGEGGDFLIVDDPHNPSQASSDVQRTQANQWFDQTFSSRLDNKKKGVIIVVMQRLHHDDLTGHILEKTGKYWEHLSIPAIAETPSSFFYFNNSSTLQKEIPLSSQLIHQRKTGEILHPEREGKKEIQRIKLELGTYAFSAQYQQSPIIQEGGMIESSWFKRHKLSLEIISQDTNSYIVQSLDSAIKAGSHNDYSVCTTWLIKEEGYYLLDTWYKKVEYPELKHTITQLAEKWHPNALLIEDKASGQSLLQDLKRESCIPLIPIHPKQDKISRFSAVTALFEAGKVYFPNRASWLADYEAQLLNFPHTPHDDMVDSTSQALHWMHHRKKLAPRIRSI